MGQFFPAREQRELTGVRTTTYQLGSASGRSSSLDTSSHPVIVLADFHSSWGWRGFKLYYVIILLCSSIRVYKQTSSLSDFRPRVEREMDSVVRFEDNYNHV